ncbi:MAG: response regulator [Candidatus Binatia bacterium]
MKILVVDDDESSLRMMRSILTAERHEPYTARNGLFGYFSFLVYRPELVLTDIEMPFQDGFEMMKQIRNIDPLARTIYMSGEVERYYTRLDAERRNYAAAVLEKPFSRRDLSALISSGFRSWLRPESGARLNVSGQGFGPSA